MTLILLLLILVTERVALQGVRWQAAPYLTWYVEHFSERFFSKGSEVITVFLFTTLPAISIGIVLYFIDLGLIEFVASLFVLAVAIGNANVRALYRQYLNAETRGDSEAMAILQMQLANDDANDAGADSEHSESFQTSNSIPSEDESSHESPKEVNQTDGAEDVVTAENERTAQSIPTLSDSLIWCNFKYYATPIFYFVVFGLPGVVFYTTLLYLHESGSLSRKLPQAAQLEISKWLEWVFWVPSRLVSVGFMFVGHFTNGLESYLKLAANFSVSSKSLITQVAHAAEGGHIDNNAKNMVKLAKRNMALFVVVVALLTLYGYIV
jgi:AmpE protein